MEVVTDISIRLSAVSTRYSTKQGSQFSLRIGSFHTTPSGGVFLSLRAFGFHFMAVYVPDAENQLTLNTLV